jgi:cystathionine beta-lyase
MSYDFDTIVDRHNSHSLKWCFPEHFLPEDALPCRPLPMWVADMDFRTAPEVIAALHQGAEHGVFGYCLPTRSCIEAITDWQWRRFGWRVDPDWILQTPGVVTGLAMIVQAFTEPSDKVLVQAPVYGPFRAVPERNGRQWVEAPLVLEGAAYAFDPELFETCIRQHRPKLFILCNPHNPTGNVWSRAELAAMSAICIRHGVLVVADEIHEDLVFDRTLKHITFASLDEASAHNAIVCTAPSKTFNLAGQQVSNLFVPNPQLRETLKRQMECCGISHVNQLGLIACEAAYRHGEPWLEALLNYLAANHARLAEAAGSVLGPIRVTPTGALYLAWLDCRGVAADEAAIVGFFLKEARLWLDNGTKFGTAGAGFMRLNLGCPRRTLEEAIDHLATALRRRGL